MNLSNLKLAGKFYVAGVLAIHVLVIWNARSLIWKGYPDFTIYYSAGTIIRQGMGHRLYDDATQFRVQQEFAPQVATRLGALPFNHPPFEALLFVPFSYLSYRAAFLLWTVANLAMLAALPVLLRAYVPLLRRWPAPALTLVSLGFFPIFFALLQGQDAVLLSFLYAMAFVSLKKDRLTSAGAWLSCGLFKFHLVLPFFFLLLIQEKHPKGRQRIMTGFLLVAIILGVVSILTVGTQQMVSYPRYVLGLERTMSMGAIMPSDMPNLRGVLYLIASDNQYFDALVISVSLILFLVAAWTCGLRGNDSNDLKFSLAVFATVLVSYHGLGYDLCVLAIPVLLVAGQLEAIKSGFLTKGAIMAGLAVLLFSPLQLVLLMRCDRLALLGWSLLLCFVGLAAELRFRLQRA